ncbi:MAG: pyridoxine 5'-phosphate synthase [Bdellovibrionales bacterium]
MTKLSVNVNKLATIRNARGKNTPDLVQAGRDILAWGAHGLTVHPRPDGRHIRFDDVYALSGVVREFNLKSTTKVEFNIEGYPNQSFLNLVKDVQPDQATLVPDPPEALTSNAGWAVADSQKLLKSVCAELHAKKVRTSVFIDPVAMQAADYAALKEISVDRAELYTEAFADTYQTAQQDKVLNQYQECAQIIRQLGLGLNAGHDLNQKNLAALIHAIPEIEEVSIGHALICEALYLGLPTTVANYLKILGWK